MSLAFRQAKRWAIVVTTSTKMTRRIPKPALGVAPHNSSQDTQGQVPAGNNIQEGEFQVVECFWRVGKRRAGLSSSRCPRRRRRTPQSATRTASHSSSQDTQGQGPALKQQHPGTMSLAAGAEAVVTTSTKTTTTSTKRTAPRNSRQETQGPDPAANNVHAGELQAEECSWCLGKRSTGLPSSRRARRRRRSQQIPKGTVPQDSSQDTHRHRLAVRA